MFEEKTAKQLREDADRYEEVAEQACKDGDWQDGLSKKETAQALRRRARKKEYPEIYGS